MHEASDRITDFLDAAAAKQPTPGGGSIAALAGALAASMGEMVLNYSVNKKDLQAHRRQLDAALTQIHRARELLLGLMVEDQVAYETLTSARKQGPGVAFEVALLAAIRVPQAIGATGLALLQICETLVDKVNRHLLSDLAVCCELAMATVRCASYNVRANLLDVSEEDERREYETETARTVADGTKLISRIISRIMNQPT